MCAELGIETSFVSAPRHPLTNGMVERFNGRIAELVGQTRLASAAELKATLARYLVLYNHTTSRSPL